MAANEVSLSEVNMPKSVRSAYTILHTSYIIAPIVAGVDKFFNFLTNWEQYLALIFPQMLGISSSLFMRGVGIIEIAAGILAIFKPNWAGYIIALWLWGIIFNLLIMGSYYDIALRDFGLSLGALALARLAKNFT